MVLSLFHLESFPDGSQQILASTFPFSYSFFRTRGLLPRRVPRESSSLAYGCRRMFNISPGSSTSPPPKGPSSTRKKETSIESWMRGSQPARPAPWKKHRHLSSFDIAAVNALLVPNSPASRFLPSHALCNHSTFQGIIQFPQDNSLTFLCKLELCVITFS